MTASRKQSVIALSLSQGIAALVNIVILATLSRILSKLDLASFRQTILVYTFLAPILQVGIVEGIYYFLPNEKNNARGRLIESILILFSTSCIFSLFILLGGNQLLKKLFNNPSLELHLLWLVPLAIFTIPASHFTSVLVSQKKPKLAASFTAFRQFAIGATTITVVVIYKTGLSALLSYTIASVLLSIIAIGLMLYTTQSRTQTVTKKGFFELATFSLPLGMSGMIGIITMQTGSILVATFSSPEDFAIYNVGAFEIPLIAIITSAMTSAYIADMTKMCKSGRKLDALRLWKESSTKAASIIFPTTAFLFFHSEGFITLLFSEKYKESAFIFKVFLLMLPIRVFLFGALLVSLGEPKFILKRTAQWAVANLILTWLLIRWLGPIGAAIALVSSQYLFSVPVNLLKIRKSIGCSVAEIVPLRHLSKIAIVSLLAVTTTIPMANITAKSFNIFSSAFIYALTIIAAFKYLKIIDFYRIIRTSF